MSSFNSPHHIYLFLMKNGKRKLGYGPSAEEAFENLRLRLTEAEMAEIDKDQYLRIPQRELQQHVKELG
jgi:hypothetical protein